MKTNWPIEELGNLVDPLRGISYGIVQPGQHTPNGVPIVRVSDLKGELVDTKKPLRVSSSIESSYDRTRLRGGELIMSIVGTIGQTAIVDENLKGWNVARAVAVIPVKEEIGPYWVRLSLKGGPAKAHINERLNTTVQATLNLRDLASLPIALPPISERNHISAIFAALDDKIDLNRRMNETLEALACALFKDWFVDFGPTKAKMEERLPYLAPEIWNMFPDRLDDEGKPKGWKRFQLSQIAEHHKCTLKPSAVPDELFEHFSLPAFDKTQSPALDYGSTIKSNKTIVPPEAVLLSKLNPEIPRVWLTEGTDTNRQIASTEFLAFTAKEGFGRGLLFSLFLDRRFREILLSMVTGTSKSHQRVSPPSLMRREVIVGNEELFSQFQSVVEPMLKRICSNRAETRTLVQTRDFLLPKLMTGEIRVADAEQSVQEAR
ncbi:restriction endonuclease subunit S [Thalassospira sp. HF15]|uniref:restriction endonuclease subunit S n=1 Tax=Thalassospira sp. HF15 TaxID=2722755 RepID=UPI0014308948|nr:restriction endonuclease subunit S [Thalassospira sp. HF15]NIY75854.1 restriction endonuclease subunit S [Thalassospira sp. HF15]